MTSHSSKTLILLLWGGSPILKVNCALMYSSSINFLSKCLSVMFKRYISHPRKLMEVAGFKPCSGWLNAWVSRMVCGETQTA